MPHLIKINRKILILIFACVLTSGQGCATLAIPGYRLEQEATAYNCAQQCENSPSPLPSLPLPGWWARWKAERDLPKAPASPRFHPIPTRPMFSPAPASVSPGRFGQLPSNDAWNSFQVGQFQPQIAPSHQ
jgi:hypothetical protein